MKTFLETVGAVVVVILLFVGLGLLLAWPVMLLWNSCLVGTIGGISKITSIWHAWGLMILFAFLFKSSNTSKKD